MLESTDLITLVSRYSCLPAGFAEEVSCWEMTYLGIS